MQVPEQLQEAIVKAAHNSALPLLKLAKRVQSGLGASGGASASDGANAPAVSLPTIRAFIMQVRLHATDDCCGLVLSR
jgi:hypothetical protein